MKKLACLCIILILALSSLACGGAGGAAGAGVTLNVLNWGDYIDPSLIKQFTEETGIQVKYTTMTSNEEMLVKLSSADCIYDVCFPSDYVIEKLIQQQLLHPLNKDNIPNLSNIDPRFMDLSFDPENTYSVPYMWGTVGILYNTTMVDEPVVSWDILWDEKYAGQVIMYDSLRDTIGVTLIKLGYDINSRSEEEIAAARDELIAQKPMVRAYLTDDIKQEMVNGNAALAVNYSGDSLYAMADSEDLAFAVPQEGSNVWFDNIIIFKTSQHTAEAEAFINFLCDGEVAKQNCEYICYSSPNAAAVALMGDDYANDETWNPPQEVLDRCEIFHDLGDFINVFTDAWAKIKAA